MAGETLITVIGNLTADPELRFTPSGAAVANFTVASTPRAFDRQSNEWEDAETLFLRCSVWRDAAENAAESLSKGTRVIVQGYLKARISQDREGNQRTSWELDVQELGPSMRYATAKVQRNARGQGNASQGFGSQQGNRFSNQQNQNQGHSQGQQHDPWSAAVPGGQEVFEGLRPMIPSHRSRRAEAMKTQTTKPDMARKIPLWVKAWASWAPAHAWVSGYESENHPHLLEERAHPGLRPR